MVDEVLIQIELSKARKIVALLRSSLEPMVPYKRDPLEFSEAAHDVKNEIITEALSLFPEVAKEDDSHGA